MIGDLFNSSRRASARAVNCESIEKSRMCNSDWRISDINVTCLTCQRLCADRTSSGANDQLGPSTAVRRQWHNDGDHTNRSTIRWNMIGKMTRTRTSAILLRYVFSFDADLRFLLFASSRRGSMWSHLCVASLTWRWQANKKSAYQHNGSYEMATTQYPHPYRCWCRWWILFWPAAVRSRSFGKLVFHTEIAACCAQLSTW